VSSNITVQPIHLCPSYSAMGDPEIYPDSLSDSQRSGIENWLNEYAMPQLPAVYQLTNDIRVQKPAAVKHDWHLRRKRVLQETDDNSSIPQWSRSKQDFHSHIAPDPDLTPRAPKIARRATDRDASDASSDAPSTPSKKRDGSTSASGESGTSERGGSPIKAGHLPDLQEPILLREFFDLEEDKPGQVQNMEKDIRLIAGGSGILPRMSEVRHDTY
jgi:hypothetical protein